MLDLAILLFAFVLNRKHIASLWIELYNVIQTRCTETNVDDNLVAIDLKRKAVPNQIMTYSPGASGTLKRKC